MTIQLGHGISLARQIRAQAPEVPIVWGGAHASLFPEGTAGDGTVDFVLMGEADQSAIRLAEALSQENGDFSQVPGLYRVEENGRVLKSPTEGLVDVASLPPPAYHLLPLERYATRTIPDGRNVRGIDLLTSRGCPYRCAFCPNELLLGRRWRKRPVEQVIEELDRLLHDGSINHVWFMDDLFIGDKKRVVTIVEHMHRRYQNVLWEANVRPDMFRDGAVDMEFLRFLRETGCASLRMGAESGNNRVLEILKKDITVEETEHAVSQCHDIGIAPVLFFMMGIPGERREELFDTLEFMARLKRNYHKTVVCGPGLFRPYPGGELYHKALEAGLEEPKSLSGWVEELGSQGFLLSSRLPWIDDPRLMEDILFYMFHIEELDRLGDYSYPGLRRMLARGAFWRADKRFWRLRLEATARRIGRKMRAAK